LKICHIVGAGEMGGARIEPRGGDFVIAADAGYAELIRQGIKADLVVGDFDSLGEAPAGETVVRHPVMKDDTDMMLAVKLGLERGFRDFRLYGALGGRLDHTLANLQALQYIAAHGARGLIVGDVCAAAVQNGALRFRAAAEGVISVFCLASPAHGVDLDGLLYPLTNHTLTPDFPLGVSNEFTGVPACVRVREGCVVAVFGSFNFLEE
jgi:thiamine pyrophosphokinase